MPVAPSRTACVEFSDLFQHALLEDPPTSSAPLEQRRQSALMQHRAAKLCAECPLRAACLYEGVVNHDMAGFAGGATQKQRNDIRRRLGVSVNPEDFDTLAGVTARNRQIDGAEVVRLRNANPHESLETLAHRLGCSLSTVKRHLRKARAGASVPEPAAAPKPTVAAVLDAYDHVVVSSRDKLEKAA